MGTSQVESIPWRENRYWPMQPETPQQVPPKEVNKAPLTRLDIEKYLPFGVLVQDAQISDKGTL